MLKRILFPTLLGVSNIHAAQKVFTRLLPHVKIGIPLAVGFGLTTQKKFFALEAQNQEQKYTVELTERDYRSLQEVIFNRQKELLSSEEEQSTNNSDSQQFLIKQPIPLTEEEKNTHLFQRIASKYIGTLPEEILDIIGYFHFKNNSDKKINPINTTLLHGEPGTGKTYLVKTLAQELQVPYMYCNCTIFNDKYFGQSQEKITNFFKIAKKSGKPIFLMIDEIDAIALSRDNNQSCNETLMTLLTEVQDLESHPEIFVFIATNSPERLDFAIMDRFNAQTVKIDKIKTQEHLHDFFKKSLKDRGFTTEQEINAMASQICEKFDSVIWGRVNTSLSIRSLSKIVQKAMARKHRCENMTKKSKDFMVYVDQVIREMENAPKPKSKNSQQG